MSSEILDFFQTVGTGFLLLVMDCCFVLIQIPLVLKHFLASGTLMKDCSATKPEVSLDAKSIKVSIAIWTSLSWLVELLCVPIKLALWNLFIANATGHFSVR